MYIYIYITLFCWYHSVIPKKPKRFQKCQKDDVTRQNTSKTMTKCRDMVMHLCHVIDYHNMHVHWFCEVH